MVQEVNNTTTAAQMNAWIDEAVGQKKWLVLEMHQVDHSGLQYSTTPEILQQAVNHLLGSGASVITVHQGLQLMP